MMRNNIKVLLILFLGTTGILRAQDSLSLELALKTGLENNFNLRITELNKELSRNNNRWGATGFLPALSANAGYDISQNNIPDSVKTGSQSMDVGVSLNWTVFNGFSAVITKSQLELLVELSAGSAAVAVENTMQGIILAYYNILLQEKQLQILQTVQNISGDRYRQASVKQELGTSVTFDVLQAKHEYLSDSSRFLRQRLNVDNAYRSLNLLLAEDLEKRYDLNDTLGYAVEDFSLENLKEKAFASNKNLLNQYINNEILKKDVSLAKNAFSPLVSVNGSLGKNLSSSTELHYLNPEFTIEPAGTNPLSYYLGFTVNFNLFNGGNRVNALKNAKLSEQIGVVQQNQLEFSLNNQLLAQYYLYLTQQQVLDVALENMKVAELNLQLAKEKFELGILNSFNYRDIQLAYLNAAYTKYQSLFNIINTHTELLRLSGGLITEN